jgi:aspartate carbamoyltransferase catalytic subunit
MKSDSFYGLPHVIDARQFDRGFLEQVFQTAKVMESVVDHRGCDVLRGRRMVALFYEPSTRTRFSFEMAMSYLGGAVFQTENAREFSSAVKGETIGDTIRTICGYKPDVIVLRHSEDTAAEEAVRFSDVPIINAGSGKDQHPTQALLDLYTILKELGGINDRKIAMCGDLSHGRTVRSLSYLLGKFHGVEIHFVSPDNLRIADGIKEYLGRHSVPFHECNDLRKVAPDVDVIYQTRTQTERGAKLDRNDHDLGYFTVDLTILRMMRENAIVMHPLPRVGEITLEVDGDPRAAYFRQAQNGLFIRMALLKMILASKVEI